MQRVSKQDLEKKAEEFRSLIDRDDNTSRDSSREVGYVFISTSVFTFFLLMVSWILERNNGYPLFWSFLVKIIPYLVAAGVSAFLSLMVGAAFSLASPYLKRGIEYRRRVLYYVSELEKIEKSLKTDFPDVNDSDTIINDSDGPKTHSSLCDGDVIFARDPQLGFVLETHLLGKVSTDSD